jgi:hypothetical protein
MMPAHGRGRLTGTQLQRRAVPVAVTGMAGVTAGKLTLLAGAGLFGDRMTEDL